MINEDEYSDEEVNDLIAYLIQEGALEVHGYHEKADSFIYRITPKMKEIMPTMFEEHFKFINDIAFGLWNKGYIEIKFDEKGPLVMLIPDLDYDEIMDKVSEEEMYFLENMINYYKGGII
jgi:hypothetical protein